jgi:sulfur-carrier protein adenylyltransferase/sulfurtransferase
MLIKNIDDMTIHSFESITDDALKHFMSATDEKNYVLVDVRQPGEYIQSHIPGAWHMPLSEFQSGIGSLPKDRDIIFYCHAGSRSRTAAMMAAEQKITRKKIYTLEGGISKWSGTSLGNVPKIELFDKSQSVFQMLKTTICLEKGAASFYLKIQEMNILVNGGDIFSQLSEAEISHARTLFELLKKHSDQPFQSFEKFYQGLSDDIVEGGDTLNDLMKYIHNIQRYGCINLLDLALDVEFASYDLYKTLANLKSGQMDFAVILLDIAQAEKNHMKLIADSYKRCPDNSTA